MLRTLVSPWPAASVGREFRLAATASVVVLTVVGAATAPDPAAIAPLAGAVMVVVASAALFLGRPPAPLAVALVAVTGMALVAGGRAANLGWFALCVVGGWCALRGGARDGIMYFAATAMVFMSQLLWVTVDPGWVAWTAGVAATVTSALVVRHQVGLVEQLRTLQESLLEQSRVEERNRIARDLHDVIAHSLTVSLLHVASARLTLEHDLDPAQAARALADAERLTRRSLDDVRATVGMVRSGDTGLTGPVPTIADIPALVAEVFRVPGAVALDIDPALGGPAAIPVTTSTSAYRIVQEALTNAVRHAPGAPVRITVLRDRGAVDLRVDSAGPPCEGRGQGLLSMRERAEAVGGNCTAGPGGGGWTVRARLPIPHRGQEP